MDGQGSNWTVGSQNGRSWVKMNVQGQNGRPEDKLDCRGSKSTVEGQSGRSKLTVVVRVDGQSSERYRIPKEAETGRFLALFDHFFIMALSLTDDR